MRISLLDKLDTQYLGMIRVSGARWSLQCTIRSPLNKRHAMEQTAWRPGCYSHATCEHAPGKHASVHATLMSHEPSTTS